MPKVILCDGLSIENGHLKGAGGSQPSNLGKDS